MRVKVQSILELARILGGRELEVSLPERARVADLLSLMRKWWGEDLAARLFEGGSVRPAPGIRILVNGQAVQFLEGLETVLTEGDEVLLLPMAAGG